MAEFCPGYPAPFDALVSDYPDEEIYPSADFRVEWGPVFHRGRLDGSARVVVLGQDPATHEAISRRILVGEAGQRVQGLLAKLGVHRSYVMVNTFLYSVYGQGGGNRHDDDEKIAAYRNAWLDALLVGTGVTAVISLGQLADTAYQAWAKTQPATAAGLHHAPLRHPTYPESASRAGDKTLAETTAILLADWNTHLDGLRAHIVADEPTPATVYGTGWQDGDLVRIPTADLPPGSPDWWFDLAAWATRTGSDVQTKRATISVVVPRRARIWPVLPTPPPPHPGGGAKATGPFVRAYKKGVTEKVGPPPSRPRALPPAPFALHGAVVTPEEAWSSGYVTVAAGSISAVSKRKPADVPVVETDGVILPGLIDLHGHPDFNVFAAWEPPKLYANRYRWRASAPYKALVRDPQNTILSTLPPQTQSRYAEVRALAGGVTAIQGSSAASTSTNAEPLVRNVDLWIFGDHKARAMIDLPSSSSRDVPRLKKIVADIGTGDVNAFYLHLCEGLRGDERSAKEFQAFLDSGAATAATNVIHGTALSEADLHTLSDAGCRLVWSPQSNLRLYGSTTLAGAARASGMAVALGADWLPSGSTSLLGEMKVARRQLALEGHPISAADLVAMVTSVAAGVAGLSEHLGSVAVGRPADLLVLERHHTDPYESVCLADPSWVELVSIGGDITYAREDWFGQLSGNATSPTIESLVAWGKPMRLDNGFQSSATSPTPSLSTIRGLLTAAYPPVGPIYA